MSRFIQVEYPARHPGVERLERAAVAVRQTEISLASLVLRALATVGGPIKRRLEAAAAARRQRREDDKLWQLALTDARVMADLSRAMSDQAHAFSRYY
jgi:hypothetical protein